MAVLLSACRDARELAVLELERRGYEPTPAALAEAVQRQEWSVIGFLRQAGVKAALPKAGEASVLHLAAEQNDWDLVVELLEFTDVSIINHQGPGHRVILEEAVLADQGTVARQLLKAGAQPELASTGAGALLIHVLAPDPELMDLLLAELPAGHPALTPALVRAVSAGENARVLQLLEHKAPPNALDPDGQGTVLEVASQKGFLEIAASLIKSGAQPEKSPHALPLAVERGDFSMTRLLLEAGARFDFAPDPAWPDDTALTRSLDAGLHQITRLMLEHGADRVQCLDYALAQGNSALLSIVLEFGVSLDAADPCGDPPLIRAAIAGLPGIIRKLIENGASTAKTGALGQTAYHMAIIHRQNEAAKVLIDAGVNPDIPFLKPAPPELLPLFGSDYFVKWYERDEGLTPLMLAAARGDTDQVRFLLAAGARRGAQTKSWHRYPIVFACDTVNIPAAQLLLGRDPDKDTDKRHAVISLSRQQVTLYQNDQPVRSAQVSTGKKDTPTPTGQFVITDKQTHWTSSIYKVPMPYFMRLSCKDIGLHAGAVPGYPASHGCIRLPKTDVMAFFKILKIGDPVLIEP